MACASCGGGRTLTTGSSGSGGRSPAARFRSRLGKLPWAHVSVTGEARTSYATKEEAQAAARLFGGKVVKTDDE